MTTSRINCKLINIDDRRKYSSG